MSPVTSLLSVCEGNSILKTHEKKLGLTTQWVAVLLVGALTAGFAHGGSNWVIKRDDKIDSPIFKQRPMIAHQDMAPTVEQSYIAERYAAALQDYQSKIRRQWPNAEVSSATRWVSYSDDFNTRRVVDFKSNHIEISLENPYENTQNRSAFTPAAATRASAKDQVRDLLAMHEREAMQQDPVAVALASTFEERGAEGADSDASPLIFSELFSTDQPDPAAIDAVADGLMQKARIRFQALSASSENVPVFDKKRVTYLVPLPEARLRLKAMQYRSLVRRYSEKSGLPVDGVMAMIHTESAFNPLARSHVPAFGLMQVVPSTMGRDAAAALFGNPRLFSPDYLLDAEKNIEIGTAYLSRLYNEETAAISDPKSRWYFVQAVYKVGLVKAAHMFDSRGDATRAMAAINQLQPSQVLQRLMQQDGTNPLRDYLAQTQQHQSSYQSF